MTRKSLIIGSCILLALAGFEAHRQYRVATRVARESAQRALFAEAKSLLQAHIDENGRYPVQLTELPFTYADGGDESILKDFRYSNDGSKYRLRTVGYYSQQVLEQPTTDSDRPGYKFAESQNTACFTCKHVVREGAEILYVTHDADDGGWQFLCGGDHTAGDAMIIAMREIVNIDPSVNGLSEMPEGAWAQRKNGQGEWKLFSSNNEQDVPPDE